MPKDDHANSRTIERWALLIVEGLHIASEADEPDDPDLLEIQVPSDMSHRVIQACHVFGYLISPGCHRQSEVEEG